MIGFRRIPCQAFKRHLATNANHKSSVNPGSENPLQRLIPSAVSTPQKSHTASSLGLEALLAAQLHLGHEPLSWNRHMLPYIYGTRNGLHIINLEHTLIALRRASGVAREVALAGGNIVFVGTKPSLHKLTMDTALKSNAFYVLEWVRGIITNKERVLRRSVGYDPSTVVQSLKGPVTLDLAEDQDETDDSNTNSELSTQPYVHLPELLIVLDYPNNIHAVREANQYRIPVIAICDTDCDPTMVQYPIPANDDSLPGIHLIASILSKSIQEGHASRASAPALPPHNRQPRK